MTSSRVILSVPQLGIRQSFSLDHAERLLRMPNNGGWMLPADSRYEYTEANGLRRKKKQKAVAGETADLH